MSGALAAIDCGTNTIKLLVLDADGVELLRTARMVRLGEGVDATGLLGAPALARTFAAVEEYAGLLAAHDVGRVRFCATSATRDAGNAEEFAAGVEARLGVRPEVLAGADEARLAFSGALAHLAPRPEDPEGVGPEVLVLDIGGGSTELIWGRVDGSSPPTAYSMDVGSVRLHERHALSDPPTSAEVARVEQDVEDALAGCPIELASVRTVIGVAGTVTTIAAGVLGLEAYDRARIDQQRLPVAQVHAQGERLLSLTVEDRRALGWMHPGRADVIGAGAVILSAVLRRCGARELVVSESDILDGIAASLLG